MDEARFWSIVDASCDLDQDRQLELIRASLNLLTPTELEGFEAIFDRQMQRSYRWDLWGAAYVAMGGASDDGFEYFRLWLISRGRAAFEQTIQNPDSLADIVPANPEQMEFEDFAHVAPDVWATKTGKAWDEMPHLASFFSPTAAAPIGDEFSDSPSELARRYPRLWKQFGAGGR